MSATVDHLFADRVVTVTKNFTDAAGNTFAAGESGRIRHIHLDWSTFVCTIELEQGNQLRNIVLHDARSSVEGPRSGNLREFFEVVKEEYKPEPKRPPAPQPVAEPSPRPSGSDAYRRALDLEEQDRLEEAEKLLTESIPNLYSVITIADMYRTRMIRLRELGRHEEAREARKQAVDNAYFFASLATSGGEGAALSLQRNQFLASLGPEEESE